MLMALQPSLRFSRIFQSGTVIHRDKLLSNAHDVGSILSFGRNLCPRPGAIPMRSDGDTPPNSDLWHRGRTAAKRRTTDHWRRNEKAPRATMNPRVLLSS